MSNKAGGPLTDRAPLLTVAAVRWRAGQSALISLLVLSVYGCGNDASVTPTAPTLPPGPSPTMVSVRLEGRVLDERAEAVGGARISLSFINPGGLSESRRANPPSTTTDEMGSFSLTLDLPENWRDVSLDVGREGYDDLNAFVKAPDATRPIPVNIYRSLTIAPGESIETSVSLSYGYWCGYEFHPCRRVTVTSPAGKPVDIEVTPAEGQGDVGLACGESEINNGVGFPRRVTVSDGEPIAIVVRQLGRVGLRAVSQ